MAIKLIGSSGINCGVNPRYRPTSGLTFACRVWLTALTDGTLVRSDDNVAIRVALLDLTGGKFRAQPIGGTKTAVTSATTPAAGLWYDVTATFDIPSNRTSIYVNGALDATSSTGTVGFAAPTAPPLTVGYFPNTGSYIQGIFSFAAVWTRTLSAGEIAAIAANPWDIYLPAPGGGDPSMFAYYYGATSAPLFRRGLYLRTGSRGVM
jgi:hypothetical protein